ncbi:hypothetical protein [Streptomyces sp. NPDC056323]|uniref:hypothetical protein n=1 Tax=Streptomyces sp. NPDC056323 TaxID=3345784 RepID=UPI0035D74FB3
MDERPDAGGVLAVVGIDARRCEMHRQCEGLSDAIFESPEQRVVLREGDDPPGGVRRMERLTRSCPMGALELDVSGPE